MKKYKICILGNIENNIKSAYSWFVKTTYQGLILNDQDVIGLDYKSNSIDQIRKFLFNGNFDIIFTHLTFHDHHNKFDMMETFDELRNINDTKIIHTLSDAREEPRYNGDISHAFDMALISTYNNIEKFQNYWNVPVYYWPYSSLTYNKIGTYKKELDFKIPVFPGNPYSHDDRTYFLNNLQKKLRFKIIQTKSADDIRNETLNFSASAPSILCLSTRYEMKNGFTDVRPYQFGGAGAIMIGRPHKIQKNIIPEDLWFPFYSYDDNGIQQIKDHWSKIKKMSDVEKNNFRENIFKFIQTHHSSKVRMNQTIELIEGKREKLNIFLDEI